MLQTEDQLKLYSLSVAASLMGIGRDSLRKLIYQGKIGYISIGKSKRIPHQELVRFQTDNTLRKIEPTTTNTENNSHFIKQINSKVHTGKSNFNSRELMDKILRSDNNGNNKRKRRSMAHPVV
jgi:excisionase family DNA binding protein